MKFSRTLGILVAISTCLALKQAEAQVAQHAGDCSVNINGNNNKLASLVCHEIDPKLAEQIRAIVNQILAKQLTATEAKKLFDGMNAQLADIKKGVQQLQDRPEDPNRGLLIPANDPNPVNSSPGCNTKAVGSFRLYLGSFMIISPGLRETAIDLRGKAVLGFTKHNGSLGISAAVNDPNGKQVAFLKDGYFKLDEYFRKELPDRSTLNVYNQTDDTPVLHVRYLNENAVQVTGKFFNAGAALDITDDTFQILHNGVPSMTFQGGCGYAPNAQMPGWDSLFYVY
jgi:hypothetical protein